MSSSFRSKFRSIETVNGPGFWPTIGWIVAGLFVQSAFAPWIDIAHASPSFVTIAVVLYASRLGTRRGLAIGAVAGTLTDLLAGTGGAWAIAESLMGLCCGAVSRGFFADGIVPPSVLVGLALLLRNAIFWSVMSVEGFPPGYALVHAHAALESAALTSLCAFAYLLYRSRFASSTRIVRYG